MASEFDISQAAAAIYAESLLQLATEAGQAESIGQEMEDLAAIWKVEPGFAAMMLSAAIDVDARRDSLKRIFADRLSPLTMKLLLVLNAHRRSSILAAVCDSYRRKLAVQLGRQSVFVSTAVPLDDARREKLRAEIRRLTRREPVLFETVDPDLLGGMAIQVGDKLYDTTIRSRIRKIRSILLASTEQHLLAGGDRFVTEG